MAVPKPQQLPSGSWRVQVTINGRRFARTFATQKEAAVWALSMKASNAKKGPKDAEYENMLRGILGGDSQNAGSKKVKIPTVKEELEKVDAMDGAAFETYCASLFRLTGYFHGGASYTTKEAGDFGADVIIECVDGKRIAIQCKRYKSNVGIDAVQEVYASKNHYYATEAAVITNARFTPAAKELAKNTGVYLLDRKSLTSLIELYIKELDKLTNKNQWELLMEAIAE